MYLAELKPSRWVGGGFYFGTAFMSTPATEGVKCEDRMTAADRPFNHRSVRLNVLNEIVLPYSNTEQTSITTPGNIGLAGVHGALRVSAKSATREICNSAM